MYAADDVRFFIPHHIYRGGPPMPPRKKPIRFYCDGIKFYSVDMIFNWIEDTGQTSQQVAMADLVPQLDHEYWGDPRSGHEYSPMDVAGSPDDYPEEIERTSRADLRYPIILEEDTGYVIDGLHRLLKKYMRNGNRGYISAYRVPRAVLRRFIIGRSWEDMDRLKMKDIRTHYSSILKTLS